MLRNIFGPIFDSGRWSILTILLAFLSHSLQKEEHFKQNTEKEKKKTSLTSSWLRKRQILDRFLTLQHICMCKTMPWKGTTCEMALTESNMLTTCFSFWMILGRSLPWRHLPTSRIERGPKGPWKNLSVAIKSQERDKGSLQGDISLKGSPRSLYLAISLSLHLSISQISRRCSECP